MKVKPLVIYFSNFTGHEGEITPDGHKVRGAAIYLYVIYLITKSRETYLLGILFPMLANNTPQWSHLTPTMFYSPHASSRAFIGPNLFAANKKVKFSTIFHLSGVYIFV